MSGELRDFDRTVPSSARIYDALLGGKDHYQADRVAADKLRTSAPWVARAAQQNRMFSCRAAEYCASVGIDQFVDIGTGFPTSPNVCEAARKINADAVMVGVDNDPIVAAHDVALLDGVHIIEGDIRRMRGVVDDPELNTWIDWSRPVAVLFVAILHFITDTDDPHRIVRAVADRMASGSHLVISHACSTDADPDQVTEIEGVFARSTSPAVFRTRDQISRFFTGFELVEPGLVPVNDWRPTVTRGAGVPLLGAVARKP